MWTNVKDGLPEADFVFGDKTKKEYLVKLEGFGKRIAWYIVLPNGDKVWDLHVSHSWQIETVTEWMEIPE